MVETALTSIQIDVSSLSFRVATKTKPILAKPINVLLSDQRVLDKFLLATLEGRPVEPDSVNVVGPAVGLFVLALAAAGGYYYLFRAPHGLGKAAAPWTTPEAEAPDSPASTGAAPEGRHDKPTRPKKQAKKHKQRHAPAAPAPADDDQ